MERIYGTAGSVILICPKCFETRNRNPHSVRIENEHCFDCREPMRYATVDDFALDDLQPHIAVVGRERNGERWYEFINLRWHQWCQYEGRPFNPAVLALT